MGYYPPGSFGAGSVNVGPGVNLDGWIVDVPTTPSNPTGIASGTGNTIPNGADVDFVKVDGQWIKIKHGHIDIQQGSDRITINGNHGAMSYPVDNPPPFWDWWDDKNDNGTATDDYYDYIDDHDPTRPC